MAHVKQNEDFLNIFIVVLNLYGIVVKAMSQPFSAHLAKR